MCVIVLALIIASLLLTGPMALAVIPALVFSLAVASTVGFAVSCISFHGPADNKLDLSKNMTSFFNVKKAKMPVVQTFETDIDYEMAKNNI